MHCAHGDINVFARVLKHNIFDNIGQRVKTNPCTGFIRQFNIMIMNEPIVGRRYRGPKKNAQNEGKKRRRKKMKKPQRYNYIKTRIRDENIIVTLRSHAKRLLVDLDVEISDRRGQNNVPAEHDIT